MTETIRINYTLADMQAALSAHYHAIRPPLFKTAAFVLLVALGVALLKNAIEGTGGPLQIAETAAIIALIVVIMIAPLRWIGFRSIAAGAARNFALQRDLHGEITMGFDDTGMTWQTEYGHSHRPYPIIPFWYAHEGMVLIYQSETSYFLIPAAAFADAEQRQRLIDQLRSHGVKERRG